MSGRPPLSIGTYGTISTQKRGISWRASCLFRDSDGITRPIERNRKTKADAERALKVAIRDHETAARVGELSGESTIAQLMEVFWAWKLATKKLAAGSKTNYADVITRIIVPGLGAIRLREATTGRLDTWYLRERETRRAQAELAKTLLNQAFKLAARRDALPYNPMSGLSVPDEDRTPVRALTDQELETMRNAVRTMRQNTWLPDIFETQYTLGLRIGEVLALTVDDLDLHNEDGPIVHINSTVITPTGKPERQPHTKDGPAGRRPVVAPDWVAELLDVRALAAGTNGLLFPSRNGTLLDPHNVRESWRNIRAQVGLEWVTPHHLRKTAAARVEAMFGEEITSVFLGHKSVDVTRKYYIPAKPKIAPDVRRAFTQGYR
jgi:integrase